MKRIDFHRWATTIILLAAPSVARADVRLPHVFADHMVLQADLPVNLWGWSDPGEAVTVHLADEAQSATANPKGEWSLRFPARKASLVPVVVTVSGKNTLTLNDVLVGEVWLCSGQSNMALTVAECSHSEEEIAGANHPLIRTLTVGNGGAHVAEQDINGTWKVCSPQTAADFSGTAYYFGRQLSAELNRPVGLIVAAAGGSPIEAWMPPEGYAVVPALPPPPQPPDKYNAMTAPFTKLSLRGVLWYQGEANHTDGALYLQKTQVHVAGLRRAFGQPELPYYYVMIAPFDYGGEDPKILPTFWEAQAAALSIPHTGMVVTTDIGTPNDIHARNKQDVGRRLALWALAKTYARHDVVCSGPTFKSLTATASGLIVTFENAAGGLGASDGKPLREFELRDARQEKFVPADAAIQGSSVILTAVGVTQPVAVRFAWKKTPDANLVNAAHLPAMPFRAGPATAPNPAPAAGPGLQ